MSWPSQAIVKIFIFQAVNLVNGMIVDGLGHVSLDSGTNSNAAAPNVQQHSNNALSQANIHQGSTPRL